MYTEKYCLRSKYLVIMQTSGVKISCSSNWIKDARSALVKYLFSLIQIEFMLWFIEVIINNASKIISLTKKNYDYFDWYLTLH